MLRISAIFIVAVMSLLIGACASDATKSGVAGKTIKSGSAGNNLTVTLSNNDGILRYGKQQVQLSFTDASGKPVDVGAVALNFHMPAMGTMPAMNDAATLTTTATPGIYSGNVSLQMSGEWQAQITYEGAAGKGKANLAITAQ